jgi:hypothetical protein
VSVYIRRGGGMKVINLNLQTLDYDFSFKT